MELTPNGAERITRLEERMGVVEEGVSNFRDFQTEARAFFTEFRVKEQARKEALLAQQQEVKDTLAAKDRIDSLRDKRIIRWLTFGGVLATIFLVLLAYVTWRESEKKAENNPPEISQPAVKSPQDAKGWPTQ